MEPHQQVGRTGCTQAVEHGSDHPKVGFITGGVAVVNGSTSWLISMEIQLLPLSGNYDKAGCSELGRALMEQQGYTPATLNPAQVDRREVMEPSWLAGHGPHNRSCSRRHRCRGSRSQDFLHHYKQCGTGSA